MSAPKTYTPRRLTDSTQPLVSDKLRDKVEKLQELFPNWSNEDLQSVLTETAGDVELAVTRISEGHAEQWGSVTRKKDKKNAQPSQTTLSITPRGDRDRLNSESRGGRGGRGGRGRSGGGRGNARGTHASSYHRETTPTSNGVVALGPETVQVNEHVVNVTNVMSPSNDGGTEAKVNGVAVVASETRNMKTATSDSHESVHEPWTIIESSATSSSVAGWSVDSTVEATPTTPWVSETGTTEVWSSTSFPQNGSSEVVKAKSQSKTSKVPPGAKLSWAQIARAQDKPKPVAPLSTQPFAPPQPPAPAEPVPTPTTAAEETPQDQQHGWEEPTTVEPPTWDDEPPSLPQQISDSQISTNDGWITADTVSPPTAPPEAWEGSATFSAPRQDSMTQGSNWSQTQPDGSPPVPSPQVTTPSVTSLSSTLSTISITTSTAPTSKPSTPSVTNASARPAHVHKSGARYPKSDQAVVIPAFAGNIGTSGEKLGMQFGSLCIGGEDTLDGNFKVETTQPPSNSSEPSQQPSHVHQAQAPAQSQPSETIPSSIIPATTSQNYFQQPSQSTTSVPTPVTQVQSPPQPSQLQQQPAPSGPPFGAHQAPPALTHQQHQQHQQQHPHSYVQPLQHPIHAHFDGPPASQQQQQPQHPSGPQTGSYFRQPESPYYHNPTPPQSAPPDHQSAYGTTFSPLGVSAGAHTHVQTLAGQGQGSHLSGFGTAGPADYNYSDAQRGFYDYTQPGTFSNRLVHDEPSKGGLPIPQGNPPNPSLGSAAGQSQASGGPQGSSSQPPAGQQGQQQSYPAPMPYYYPPYYPQNSYPTYPNPSYGQAYMPKYPPVYAHQAPVGPGSAPPPTGKGPSGTASYSASASQSHLYHGQGGFDDPTANYQHHQGSANLTSSDYQKPPPHQQQQPLYGAQAAQGLQSFLGIQQTPGSGQGVVGPGGQQRTGASPETAYKPYGPPGASDKGGVGLGTQPGQQGRVAGVQQSQQQAGGAGSFYPGGRYGGGTSGPQQGQQQGQGYPQSGDQGQFYPYQPRHQGGYWQ